MTLTLMCLVVTAGLEGLAFAPAGDEEGRMMPNGRGRTREEVEAAVIGARRRTLKKAKLPSPSSC